MIKPALNHLGRFLLTAIFLSLAAGCMSVGKNGGYDCGFFVSRDRDLDGSERFRALGPLVEAQKSRQGQGFAAVRPLCCRVTDPESQKRLTEFLWPAGMFKDFKEDRYWRFLPAWGNDYDTRSPGSRSRFNIFPILWSGKSANGEKYFALFPVGGKINEFLGRDKVVFALFPLYGYGRVRDVGTHSVLWPLISWTKGDEVRRLRLFPFYGSSFNKDRWQKRFVMWPLWTSARYLYPDEQGGGFIMFPVYGQANCGDKRTWMVLPPLFRYSVSDDHTELNCPYPFVQYVSGNREKLYLWPLWGKKNYNGVMSSFLLWPIITRQVADRNDSESRRFTILPLLINDSDYSKKEETVTKRYFKLWPLISYRREGDVKRLRVPDLWMARDVGPVERNFAPLWTLYSRKSVGEARETELLWGLYRNRRGGSGGRRWSVFPLFSWDRTSAKKSLKWKFLCGLVGYEREGLQKRYNLLYFFRFQVME